MNILLENVSKRFEKHWIFKNISYSFLENEKYAILGPNGCGKSTLLRIIAGIQGASGGKIFFQDTKGETLIKDNTFRNISFAAPGIELIDEMTLTEFLHFHFSFKSTINNLTVNDIITVTGLDSAKHKSLSYFSSGMKQRVKLAQAIFADTPVLILDEPCTNLDFAGVQQYFGWVNEFSGNRLVIIASNDEKEYSFCQQHINLLNYK